MTTPCFGRTDVWFSDNPDAQTNARQHCRYDCLIQRECLTDAIRNDEGFTKISQSANQYAGIWGGATAVTLRLISLRTRRGARGLHCRCGASVDIVDAANNDNIACTTHQPKEIN